MSTTVTIGTDPYDVYVSPAQVDTYANGMLTASAWDALVPDDKSRVVVSVTRWIDSQCWKGDKVDPSQPLAWPRTVGDIAVIEQAAVMLSVLLAANPELMDQMTGATVAADGGTKRLKAGSVEIEYFRKLNFGIYATGALEPFPRNVMVLLSEFLCASGAAWGLSGSVAFGTGEPSRVGTWDRYGFWRPI